MTRRALVVNCSWKRKRTAGSVVGYNLGARKLSDWLRGEGWEVTYSDGDPGLFCYGYDLVALSVVFSWDAPLARDIALRVKDSSEVWCGGPGMFTLVRWWKVQTGLEAHKGLDMRFERQRGKYLMTFASRGCPVGCSFCIVPRLEGLDQTLDYDFQPAPVLCDNNLSALPLQFQDYIVKRYKESGVPLLDANSGFEPRTFGMDTYCLWAGILRGPWRFAFDELREEEYVEPMMNMLRELPRSRKRVYVLIGNEPIEACHCRAQKVIEWGGEPYCQPYMLLNALSRDDLKVAHDWTKQKLRDFARYYNRFLWRYMRLEEYSNRKGEAPPFRDLEPRRFIA